MTLKFPKVTDWLAELRRSAENDDDNFVPIFGKPGDGKSTIALQLGRALDPRLTVDQVHMGVANFLANAPPGDDEITYQLRKEKLEAGGVPGEVARVLAHRVQVGDEMELSGRMAMHSLPIAFQQFEKDCRGLNLDQFICFPDEQDFDRLYAFRARFKVVIVRRGRFRVFEKQERWKQGRGGVGEKFYVWVLVGDYISSENRGSLWSAYRAKKEAHMASLGGQYREEARNATSGVDVPRAVAYFSGLKVVDKKARSSGASLGGP